MAMGPQFSLLNSEFNEFLFAFVGEQKNGAQLTVLSALTRLNFDPWREAARLSDLPKEAAARALAAAIALLPEGDWKGSDAWAIAARLVDRLPTRGASAVQLPRGNASGNQQMKLGQAKGLLYLVLAVAVLIAIWHLFV
jgi:hypothetical protein